MAYKVFSFLLFLGLSYSLLQAQRLSVSGKVMDDYLDEPLPFAQIAVFQEHDSTLVTGGIANEEGIFEITGLSPGVFRFELSFIGYETSVISPVELQAGSRNTDLGIVRLNLSRTALDEVEITGQVSAVSRRIDKQVYNADEFLQAAGGTSLDVLKNIPSVAVSPDGEVSLRGTTGFTVYLNGKPTLLEPSVLLAQISAQSINTVEIITVPTAAYQAEGKGGIINITTKRSYLQGTTYSLSTMGGGSPFHKNLDPHRYGGNLNLTHTRNRLSIYAGLDYSRKNARLNREGKARLLHNESYYWMIADGPNSRWDINFAGRLGADIELSDNAQMSLGFYSGNRTEGREANYTYDNFYGDLDGNRYNDPRDNIILNSNTGVRRGAFNTAYADYSKTFLNQSRLSVSLLYENSRLWSTIENVDFSRMQPNYGDTILAYDQYDNNPLDGYRLSVDYTLPFTNGSELSFGYQPQFLDQRGSLEYDTLDIQNNTWSPFTEFLNDVEMKRWVHGAFVNYSGQMQKFSYNLGIRMEYTNQSFSISNPAYLSVFDRETYASYKVNEPDFFPSVHLQYQLNERDRLLLAYSKRINRPPSKNMAPFLLRRHYEVFVVGDPALKPEFSNTAEITYTKGLGGSLLNLTGFYRNTENAIFRVNTTLNPDEYEWYDGNPLLIRSFTNAGNDHSLGAELSGDIKIGDALRFYIGGTFYNYRVKGEIFGFEVDRQSTNWNLNSHVNLRILSNLRFFWSHNVTSATVTAQGRDELVYISDAVLSWTPNKLPNLNLSLQAENVFDTNIRDFYARGQDMTGREIFYQETRFYQFGPVFQINLSYALDMAPRKSKLPDSEFGKREF